MLSHFQDKWLPSSKGLFDSLRLPKLFDSTNVPSQDETGTEFQALAADDELQQVQEEMNFQEQFQAPEGRNGDALAQVVAVVRNSPLNALDAY